VTTRTQVAEYVADHLATDRPAVLRSAAAWLVSKGRGRQASYLARDVATVLAGRSYVLARVTTARPLSAETRAAVEAFVRAETGARDLELDATVDPAVIGGVRLEIPTAELDATVRQRLAKIVEGVQE
jgi:F-type H+-transporting ATPase subunit delta